MPAVYGTAPDLTDTSETVSDNNIINHDCQRPKYNIKLYLYVAIDVSFNWCKCC